MARRPIGRQSAAVGRIVESAIGFDIRIQSLLFPLTFLISGASLAVILWIGGAHVIDGRLTLGDFVAFNAYLTKLIFPMITLGWMIDRYQRGLASMKRIQEVLGTPPEIQDTAKTRAIGTLGGEIEFRNLTFSHNGAPVLKDIDLHIPRGSTLALVGRVGSGKTTLARLIPRLLQAPGGTVLIDGIPVDEIPLATLRACIGFVPQDTFLFSDSLRENICLGSERATETDVRWASEVAGLASDLENFPDGINGRYLNANLESTLYYSLYFPIMQLLGSVATALVIWQGSSDLIRSQIEWGALVAMLQYIPRFFWPILDVAERYAILQSAMASSERIFELLDTRPEPGLGKEGPKKIRGEIEFSDVWFAYNDDDWVLKDVSFTVKPGERLAIVGATGSGKTTIINLLCRFYDIQRGRIRIDGVDIKDWNVEELRRRVGVVQQDVFLFSGDIGANIRLRNREISEQKVEQAARDVNADRFISRLPGEYGHAVTEMGGTLSGGQRQLLAFARAIAFDPDVLVLDEATSSVDTETEAWIQDAVGRLMRSRTSIVIAHRISTVRRAHRILVLHKGEIRESGTHEALLAGKGIYHRLHKLQYIGSARQ